LLKVHPTEEEAENIMEELDLDGMLFFEIVRPFTLSYKII
jgi:hypothetical protein